MNRLVRAAMRGGRRIILLAPALCLGLTACGMDESERATEQAQRYQSHMAQAEFFRNQGQLKAAMTEVRNAVDLQPGQQDPYFLIADILLESGDADRALHAYRALMDRRTGRDRNASNGKNRARLGYAEALLLKGQFAEAAVYLDEIEQPSKAQQLKVYLLQSRIALANQDFEGARAVLQRALEQQPSHLPSHLQLSRIAWYNGEPERAQQIMDGLLVIAPDRPEVWLWQAELFANQQRFAEAASAFERALEDIGQYDVMTLQKFRTTEHYIEVLLALGRTEDASAYQKVLDSSGPGSIRNLYLEALDFYRSDRFDEAEEILADILRLAPAHHDAGILAGMVAYRKADWTKAQALLGRFVTPEDTDEAHAALADSTERIRMVTELSTVSRRLALRARDRDPFGLEDWRQLRRADSRADWVSSYRAVVAAWEAGEEAVARRRLDDWSQRYPEHAALAELARSRMQQNSSADRAASVFRQLAESTPELAAAHENLLESLSGDAERLAAATRCLQHLPDRLLCQSVMLDAAANLGRPVEVLNQLEEMAAAGEHPALNILLAEIYSNLGHFEKARRVIERTQVQLSRSSVAGAEGDAPAKSAATPGSASTRLNGYAAALREVATRTTISLVDASLSAGDATIARAMARSLVEQYPGTHRGRRILARTLLKTGEVDEAMALLRQLKAEKPDSDRPWLTEGEHYRTTGDLPSAIRAYREAWLRRPSLATSRLLYEIYRETGDNDQALKILEDWVSKAPDDLDGKLALAIAYQANQRLTVAQNLYKEILRLDRDNIVALNNLAWLYLEQGLPEALELAERAFALQPGEEAIADTFAWSLFNTGKADQAREVLQRALRDQPTSSVLRRRLNSIRDLNPAAEEDRSATE